MSSNIPTEESHPEEVLEAQSILQMLVKKRLEIDALQQKRDDLAEFLAQEAHLLADVDPERDNATEDQPRKRYTSEGLARNILRHMQTISME